MHSGNSARPGLVSLAGASLAGIAALAVPGSASAAIVVASSGPSASQYPTGKKLDDDQRITLRAGDTITVLDSRGTRVLRGPATVTSGRRAPAATNPAFAALTRVNSSSRVRTGAVRGAGEDGTVRSPNLWYLDPARGGTQCVVDPSAIKVWRADANSDTQYKVAAADGSRQTTISFAKGITTADWDSSALPVHDGTVYNISPAGDAGANSVRFVILADQPGTPEDLASVLIEKGCSAQLDLLSNSLASSSG